MAFQATLHRDQIGHWKQDRDTSLKNAKTQIDTVVGGRWASRVSNRFVVIGADEVYAYVACSAAARACDMSVAVGACEDSDEWHKTDTPYKQGLYFFKSVGNHIFLFGRAMVLRRKACWGTSDWCE